MQSQYKNEKKDYTLYVILFVVLLLCGCGSALWYFFYNEIFNFFAGSSDNSNLFGSLSGTPVTPSAASWLVGDIQ